MLQTRSKLPFYIFSGIIFGVFGIYFLTWLPKPTTPLPVFNSVSKFELTDSQKQVFNSTSLSGKIWVAQFFFTSCAGPCPIMTTNLSAIYRSYLLEKNVEFVSFSVNPETDTSDVLSAYSKRFNADAKRWHFVTGPKEKVLAIASNDFKMGSTQNPIFHSTQFALVDQKGRIRGYYEGTDHSGTKQLFKDIATLQKEQR